MKRRSLIYSLIVAPIVAVVGKIWPKKRNLLAELATMEFWDMTMKDGQVWWIAKDGRILHSTNIWKRDWERYHDGKKWINLKPGQVMQAQRPVRIERLYA